MSDAPKTCVVLALRLRAASTNAEIERLAAENLGYRFERDPDGTLIVSPTGSAAGARNARLTALLVRWNDALKEPGICFERDCKRRRPLRQGPFRATLVQR